jgi:hypothetical protein
VNQLDDGIGDTLVVSESSSEVRNNSVLIFPSTLVQIVNRITNTKKAELLII